MPKGVEKGTGKMGEWSVQINTGILRERKDSTVRLLDPEAPTGRIPVNQDNML